MKDLIIEHDAEDAIEMGSFNHGYLQIRLGTLLNNLGQYTAVADLSLDLSGLDATHLGIKLKDEIKPDIALYPKRKMYKPLDMIRMSEMPKLVIEILSPKQGSYDILEKFRIYFALGVASCWLVDPVTEIVAVYSSMDRHRTFSSDEVVDETLGIRLPIAGIFD